MKSVILDGRFAGVTVNLSKTPPIIVIGGDAYEQVNDPGTNMWLGAYALVKPITRRIPMDEKTIRDRLAKIDRIRADAKVCTKMHTYWGGGPREELVEVRPVTIIRRWFGDKTTHVTRVMSSDEIYVFRDWLMSRAGALNAEADRLSQELTKEMSSGD